MIFIIAAAVGAASSPLYILVACFASASSVAQRLTAFSTARSLASKSVHASVFCSSLHSRAGE